MSQQVTVADPRTVRSRLLPRRHASPRSRTDTDLAHPGLDSGTGAVTAARVNRLPRPAGHHTVLRRNAPDRSRALRDLLPHDLVPVRLQPRHLLASADRSVLGARDRLIAYLLPVVGVLVATSRWFSPGAFVASGDVSPYIRTNLATELTSLWNHQASGGGGSYYAILQLPDVLLLWATSHLGIAAPVAQHLQFDFILATAAVGATYLARVWLRSPWSSALAGLIAVFNYYLLITLPNLLPALGIGVTGLLAGRVLRAARGTPITVVGTAGITLMLGYLAQNPPLLVVTGTVVVATALAAPMLVGRPAGGHAARRAVGHLLRVLPWAALVNLWWLVPFGQTLFDGQGLVFTAQTSASAWAWTQVRATVLNVVSLNTAWGWVEPQYFPYSARAGSGISDGVRWVLPALAAVGLFGADRRRRRPMLVLAAAGAGLVFLAKGSHSPGGAINLWLYAHVPGFWLLRDPMSKLGVVLVLIYAVGAGVGVERCLTFARAAASRATRRDLSGACTTVVAVIAVTAIAAPWPLWTGAVTPGVNPLLAPARVRVPNSWYALAAKINSNHTTGKTLILPLDPFYQVTTTWGYHGADEVPAQLLRNPVLAELPGGYFGLPTPLSNLMNGVQTAALTGDYTQIPGLLRALGVSTVVVRSDVLDTAETPTSADPAQLIAAFRRTPALTKQASASVGSVFGLRGTTSLVSASSTLVGVRTQNAATLFTTIGSLPQDETATTGDEPTSGFTWQIAAAGGARSFDLATGADYAGRLAATSASAFRVRSRRLGNRSVLQLVDVDDVTVDGHQLAPNLSSSVDVSSPDVVGVSADGILEPLGSAGALVVLNPAQLLTAYAPDPHDAAALGAFGPVTDCANSDPLPSSQTRFVRTPVAGGFTIGALRHSACTAAPVAPTAATAVREVSFQFQAVHGPSARVCLYEQNAGCADLPSPAQPTGQWQRYDALVSIPAGVAPRLFLYADGPTSGTMPTEVRYRDISVQTLDAVGSGRASGVSSVAHNIRLTAGPHRASFTSAIPAATPLSFSSLGDCDAAEPRTSFLALQRSADGTLTLRATSDSACVSSSAQSTAGSSQFQLHAEYRTESGLPARICIWEIGPDACAALPPLETSTNWATLDTAFTPDPGTRSLQVYLYADGQRSPQTSVQYRNVELSRAAPQLLVVTPVTAKTLITPRMTTVRRSSGSYATTVTGVRGHFVLTLADSYAVGWTLSGLPRGWTARHFVADGYSNGWLITGSGSAVLDLNYGPGRIAAVARIVAGLALFVLVLEGLSLLLQRRRTRALARTPDFVQTTTLMRTTSLGDRGEWTGQP